MGIRQEIRKVRNKLDYEAGKTFYKNTAGFHFNRLGKKSLSKIKKIQINFDRKTYQSPKVIDFQNNGYVNLGQPFDPSLISKIYSRYKELIDDDNYSCISDAYDGKTYSKRVINAHKNIPEARALLNEKIINFIEQYYKTHFKVIHLYLFRNYHIPEEVRKNKSDIFSSTWHCDRRNTSWIKITMNLTDVTEKDGPLCIMSKSRTRELIKMGFKDRENPNLPEDVLEDPKHVTKLIGPSGTSMLCNLTLCLHRASFPEHGHFRDLLLFQLAPSSDPLSEDWYDQVENDDEIRYHDSSQLKT